ncbi:uncharacterized protein K452DRAFT_358146 [Aplosporella prunicola CBS 121167]|uniref:J domain-containing protein n=1 Tax=Aplosporella prunicola CBS 121167 TaxID=1176127 RepID=A0A6A6BDQ8_9PEZI|nr:uncharacterized protein K452DRAFT_358146 [Aplosporella prunicola CBS 121167]KAF2142322.1 hypothetical protein K452DRAFT_358146 [Aplosporella prunicola CBS 121167]
MPRPAHPLPTPRRLRLPTTSQCRPQQQQQQQQQQQWRTFHASRPRNESLPDHYQALELSPSASPADIKRQFYSLSKKHHPDRNRGDPAASSRFVHISEAYHVLGSPEKRQRYDRDYQRVHNIPSQSAHTHGHHSAGGAAAYAGPAGARPASGLSRRRAQFRGPPPSFYRNGAWGAHAEKRGAAAAGAAHAAYEAAAADAAEAWNAAAGPAGTGGGFGPGQATRGWDAGVPHWDRRGHARTQESVAASVARSRWRRGVQREVVDPLGGGWSGLVNFVVVSSAVAFVAGIPAYFYSRTP